MPFAANKRARTAACSKSNGVCLSFLQTGDSTGQNRNSQQHERMYPA